MEPLRIALLTSHRAPGLDALLADPNRGAAWELVMVVGSEPVLPQQELLARAGIPLELRPLRKEPGYRNLRSREGYDHDLADLLARLRTDYVLLDGWSYIVTAPLLDRFPGRVMVIHDADLSLREKDRLYAGAHAVRDAVFAGERETRSSVYVATPDVARGPLFLLSAPYPVQVMALDARERGDADFLTDYAALHRRWMIESAWGAMLVRTIELLAAGTLQTDGDVVWVDGAPGPCRMGESPTACHDIENMITRGIPKSCPFIG